MAELPGGAKQSAAPEINEVFTWATKDPEWISKLLLMGLIGLIPIVGSLQSTGWLLAMLDNLRAGRNELPPAGFRYATRGVWLWLASLIYTLILVVVINAVVIVFVIAVTALGAAGSGDHSGNGFNPLALLFIPLFIVWFGLVAVASLVLWIFVPALIEFTDRRGLAGAFDIAGILRAFRLDPQHNLAAAGLMLLAYFIGGLGAYLCWIGVIFTSPYALTIVAGVLRWYEAGVKPGSLPPPSEASAR